MKQELDSKLIYRKFFLKTKIKSYGDAFTDFHDKEIPRAGSKERKYI